MPKNNPINELSNGEVIFWFLLSLKLVNYLYLEQQNLLLNLLFYYAYLTNATNPEAFKPKTFNKAIKNNSDAKKWQDVMQDKYCSLIENKT